MKQKIVTIVKNDHITGIEYGTIEIDVFQSDNFIQPIKSDNVNRAFLLRKHQKTK